MIGLVVATHGTLGESLLATAEMIVGPVVQARAVTLSRSASPEELRALLLAAIDEVEQGSGVLVVADMFGGTPANIGMTLVAPERVELLTGVNLPMLIKFFTYRQSCPLSELAFLIARHAREGVVVASEALRRQP